VIHIRFPHNNQLRLSFYLATEEYVARQLNDGDDCFFMWQVPPSVIFGRNQDIEAEVNLDYCRANGIQVYRRKSGGGCVYADLGNVMLSYITRDEQVSLTFNRYMTLLTSMLAELGLHATSTQNNDILVGGRKVSGNAFYHLAGHSIVHGTMLFDTNPQLMEGALHPDTSKLQQKGVKSVRSRVAFLKDYLSFGVEELQQRLCALLTNRSIALTDKDLQEIEQLEQRYYAVPFLYGNTLHNNIVRSGRIEGCGTVELHFALSGSRISEVSLYGDFFDLGQAQDIFSQTFINCPFTPECIRHAIAAHHPERSIRNLSEEGLLVLILG